MSGRANVCGLILLLSLGSACRIDPEAFSEAFDDRSINLEWKDGDDGLRFRARGELSISDAGTEFVIAGPIGEVFLEEESGGRIRRLELRKTEDGAIHQSYFVNGALVLFDADAEKWLAEVSLRVARETGLGVPRRVAYLLSSGGVELVLQEVSLIQSGNARRLYVEALTAAAALSPEETRRLTLLAAEISSGAELSRALLLLINQYPEDAALTEALIAATRGVSSSSGKRHLVEAMLENRQLSSESLAGCASAVQEIRSSSEKSLILVKLAEAASNNADSLIAILEAAGTIQSSHERRITVEEVLGRSDLPVEVFVSGAEVVQGISSSSERTRALNRLVEVLPADNREALMSFLDALSSVRSASDKVLLVSRLLEKEDLADLALAEVRRVVENEISDGATRNELLRKLER